MAFFLGRQWRNKITLQVRLQLCGNAVHGGRFCFDLFPVAKTPNSSYFRLQATFLSFSVFCEYSLGAAQISSRKRGFSKGSRRKTDTKKDMRPLGLAILDFSPVWVDGIWLLFHDRSHNHLFFFRLWILLHSS